LAPQALRPKLSMMTDWPERRQSARRSNAQLGFWAATASAVLAAAAFATGLATPPRSGPYCTAACVAYPYTNVASFVPRDYLWMYPAILTALTFVILMTCIHHYADTEKKTFSHIGLGFALISGVLLGADYFIQLAVMQPSLLNGDADGLSLFSQYNPHGIFVALEDLGYLMMSVAFLFAGTVFVSHTKIERAIRWIFILSALAAIASIIGLSLIYGRNLEYRFEVVVLSINWSVLIVIGLLLSLLFRRVWSKTAS
jgi:hypothetical protein